MYSAQLGWEGKINRHIYKNRKMRKIKIIALAQLGQAEKKTKVITKHIAPAHLGWAEKM